MELAFQASFAGGRLVFDHVDGSARSFGVSPGGSVPAEDSFCGLLVAGRLPSTVPDARADGRVRSLPILRDADIGAYVGVPVPGADGRILGTLCCVSHTARPGLGEPATRLLHELAALASDALESAAHTKVVAERAALDGLLAGLTLAAPEATAAAAEVAERAAFAERAEVTERAAFAECVAVAEDVARRLGVTPPDLPRVSALARLHALGVSPATFADSDVLHPFLALLGAVDASWDGSAGPAGLAGEAIPLESRIVAACATWQEAPDALDTLVVHAGHRLDPRVVRALLDVLARPPRRGALAV